MFRVYVESNYKSINETKAVLLVDALYERVKSDTNKLINHEIDTCLITIQCLNVVKQLTRLRNFVVGKPFLEDKIWSIS